MNKHLHNSWPAIDIHFVFRNIFIIKQNKQWTLTFLAKGTIVVEISALANRSSVRVDANASVLAGILLNAHVELADSDSLCLNESDERIRHKERERERDEKQ